MPVQILLGPQSPNSNVKQAIESLPVDGPIVVITAGWRDSEGETEDLQAEIGHPIDNLMIYHRAEQVFVQEPALRELQRERQDKLLELQRLYRIRLSSTLAAARKLMRETAVPELLRLEQRAAINQVRALDRHHLRRIQSIHREFDMRRAELHLPLATAERDAVRAQLAGAGLVLIAGGHVAVLLNRIRLFRLGELLQKKNVVAWSAGAMALSDRIVLFHHSAPQGRRDAELLDAGLGIVRKRVFLPHAQTRLDWSNQKRMALFGRRFAPARCYTLDGGSLIRFEDGVITEAERSFVIKRSGRRKALKAS
jgi:peptidase E